MPTSHDPREHSDHEDADGSLDEILRVLEKVPFVSGIKRDVGTLRRVIYDRRAPRIAALGRVASGRTSLIRALMDEPASRDERVSRASSTSPEWGHMGAPGRHIRWAEIDSGADAFAIRRSFEGVEPDLVLLVASPAHVEEGVSDLIALLNDVRKISRHASIIAVLTQSDRVAPEDDREPPFSAEKRQRIDLVRQRFSSQLAEGGIESAEIYETSARQGDAQTAFGLKDLSEAIATALPEAARLEGGRVFRLASRARHRIASSLVRSCSALAITVALSPVPFSDMAVIAPLQVVMVTSVAYLSGRAWEYRSVGEWLTSIGVVSGAGFGLRWTAQQLAKLVPGAGSVVSAGVAGAGTTALGRSAISYFLERYPRLPRSGDTRPA